RARSASSPRTAFSKSPFITPASNDIAKGLCLGQTLEVFTNMADPSQGNGFGHGKVPDCSALS
ncbi:MAG: hypothetical protein ABL962_18265, partial [Fimbriimonadaceae bacterium]